MRSPTRRGRGGLAAVAAGLALAVTAVASAPAQAGPPPASINGRPMGHWGGYVDGKYATIGVSLATLNAELGLGEIHSDVNSNLLNTPLDKLNYDPPVASAAANEYSRASASLAEIDLLGSNPTLWNADQRALPQIPDKELAPGVPAGSGVPGLLTLGGITGEVKANWEADADVGEYGRISPGYDGIASENRTTGIEADLLNLSQLVPIPGVPSTALLGITVGAQTSRVGTLAQPDGSLAAYAETSPTLAGIDIFGGAGNGGISIGAGGTIGADGTFELSGSFGSTRVRAVANGKPNGADIDGGVAGSEPALPAFELLASQALANQLIPGSGTGCPTVAGRPDICRVALQPGVSLTLDFGFIWGSITFVDVQDGSERIDPGGEFSEFKFGGLTAELGVGIPGVLGLPRTVLGSVNAGIAPIDLGVEVPIGGIYAAPVNDQITLSKTVDAVGGQVQEGDVATYTVTAKNDTGVNRAGVTVVDDLTDVMDDATFVPPATATFSDGSDAGPVEFLNDELTWLGDIPLGETVTITYSVRADKPTGDHTMSNAVVASHPSLTDATAGTDTAVVNDALTVDKTFVVPGDGVLQVGDKVDYTVVVTNDTGAARAGVTVTDDLTAVLDDATYDANATATSSLGGSTGSLSFTSPNLRWTGNLAQGESVTLRYSVTVDKANADGIVTNDVTASHPDLADGTDSVTVNVQAIPVFPLWMAGGAAVAAAAALIRRRRLLAAV